jgi:hypothetical protein
VAAFHSLFCVMVLFILIGVCRGIFPASIWSDRVLDSGMYFVIGKLSPMVTGSCCSYQPTFIWSVLIDPRPPTELIVVVRQLSLFVFDILQALGGFLDVRWAHDGVVTTGLYCSAQGIIQQIGELGVALITLVCPFPDYLRVQDQ